MVLNVPYIITSVFPRQMKSSYKHMCTLVLPPGPAKLLDESVFVSNRFYSGTVGVFNVKLQNLDKTIAYLIMLPTFSPNAVQAVHS